MRRRLSILTIVVTMFFVVGCAGSYYNTLDPALVPIAKYDEALSTFVAAKESFVHAVEAELSRDVKKKMLDAAYPLFQEAAVALLAWKRTVDDGVSSADKIQAYSAVWLRLMNVLLQMGIVEVK